MSSRGQDLHGWGPEDDIEAGELSEYLSWQVGDRVRRVAGPEILLGSVGTVVATGIPGKWPIKVAVDGRIGFGEVLCLARELAPEDEGGSPADDVVVDQDQEP